MKGVILAGGTGSRLFPLTKVTNKHLLPVGNVPMIYHAIQHLVDADVRDILIITGLEHMGDVVSLLGSGTDFGAEFSYRVQDEAGGIAQALGLARSFVGDDNMLVILGDNVFEDSLAPHIKGFESGAMLFLKEVADARRFGVATLNGDHIESIVEKPESPQSNLAVTGVYLYDSKVFEYIDNCRPSARGELEITDVNNAYIKDGACSYTVLDGWWTDAGTFESLQRAQRLVQNDKS